MTFVKEKSFEFLLEEIKHERVVDKVESLYNRSKVELKAKCIMSKLTNKLLAFDVFDNMLEEY